MARRSVLILAAAALTAACASSRTVTLPTPAEPPLEAPPAVLSMAPSCAPAGAPPSAERAAFDGAVRPILESRCRPCHFEGGKMYARLPFDQPKTIRDLGEKLFTRIQQPEEQAIIRAFLSSPATDPPPPAP
jgi:hypothetical protein